MLKDPCGPAMLAVMLLAHAKAIEGESGFEHDPVEITEFKVDVDSIFITANGVQYDIGVYYDDNPEGN